MLKPVTVVILLTAMVLMTATGCGSGKDVAYLQGAGEPGADLPLPGEVAYYEARIMPKDLITISVSATDPESVLPFNLTVQQAASPTNLSLGSQPQLMTYLVDNNGQINFPELGMVTLMGLTKREAQDKLSEMLTKYLKEPPLVTLSFVNYKISVLGEVASPNTFVVTTEQINVFEALAMAGDMTLWGRRDNVKIIREEPNGQRKVVALNLNDRSVVRSPYFYLQQNDVVYVEPNNTQKRNAGIGSATSLWFTGTSIAVAVAGILVNILKR